jgi:hypothetical protein
MFQVLENWNTRCTQFTTNTTMTVTATSTSSPDLDLEMCGRGQQHHQAASESLSGSRTTVEPESSNLNPSMTP